MNTKENSMTDKEKLDAVRAEVQNYIYAARKAHTNITEGNFAHLLSFIDSLQEEPVELKEVDLEAIVEEAFDKYSSVDGYGQLVVSFNRAELYSFVKKIARGGE